MKTTYTGPDPQKIENMFSSIAGQYDRVNDVLSLGIHHLWKKKLVAQSEALLGEHVLDCATGTGDLALLFKKKVGDKGSVIGTDFCADILAHAPAKAEKAGLDISFEQADATNLQYEDNRFDIASISFGIRNVGNLDQAFKELARVCKPTGRVMILEFGQMTTPVIRHFYHAYSDYILPQIGGMLSGDKKAYNYLNESARNFPSGNDFVKRALDTGAYSKMTATPLMSGIAYIYQGTPKD